MKTGALSPLLRPLTQPLTRALSAAGVASASAFSSARIAIDDDAGNVNILVVGDSTGNEATEWVYLFGEWLADEYPTHSVDYYLWSEGGGNYAVAVPLSTGSGANTINIWNASVAGYRPNSLFGDDYANAIAGKSADLVIFNHGHNVLHTQRDRIIEGAFVGPMETVLQEYPGVGIAMILQNPNRDDSNMDNVIAAQRRYAAQRTDIRLIDVYSDFIALGKAGSLYVDNVHPSASGTQIFLNRVQGAWNSSALAPYTTAQSWLSQTATNVVPNGNFATFTPPAAPTGWVLLSSATNDKDLVIVDGADPYSLKLTNGAAALGRLYTLFSNGLRDSLKGKVVSLSARVYRPSASSNFAGQVAFTVTSTAAGTVEYIQAVNPYTKDGWYWEVIPNVSIPNDTTSIEIRLFADSTNSGNSSNYGKVIVVEGNQPRTIA